MVWMERSVGRLVRGGTAEISGGWGPEGLSPEVASAVAEALAGHGVVPGRVALVLPDQAVFIRDLILPFGNPAKVGKVLPLELESLLPCPSQDLVVDFQISGRVFGPERAYRVLAGAVNRERITTTVQTLKNFGLEPDVADAARNAWQALLGEIRGPVPELYVLLDLGPDGPVAYLVRKGRIEASHSFPLGPTKRSEQEFHSPESIVHGLRQAVLAFGSEAVERIALAGDGSARDGFAAVVEAEAGVVCQPLFELVPAELTFEGPESFARWGLACAGALRLARSRRGFNFLRGDLASSGKRGRSRRLVIHAAVALAVILGCLAGSVLWQEILLQRDLSHLEFEMRRVVRQVAPGSEDRLLPAQFTSVVRDRVGALKAATSPGGGPSQSMLEILLALSRGIGPEARVRILQLNIDRSRVRISGDADAFGTVESAKAGLESSGFFRTVRIQGVTSAQDGQGVRFSMEMETSG